MSKDSIFWMSFVDPSRPEGDRFLGVAMVQAESFDMAHALTHTFGINPGGELQSYELEEDGWERANISPDGEYMNRLLSKEELKGYDLI